MATTRHHIVYWTGDQFHAAIVASNPSGPKIVRYGVFETSQTDAPQLLREFVRRSRARHEPWVAVVPQADVLWQSMTLPTQQEAEIAKMVEMASLHAVWDPQELVVDYRVVAKPAEGQATVQLGIMRRDVLKKYVDFLETSGIRRVRWCVSSLAVKCLAEFLMNKPVEHRTVLVYIEPSASEVVCVNNSHSAETQHLPAGSRNQARLAQQLKIFLSLPGRSDGQRPMIVLSTEKTEGQLWGGSCGPTETFELSQDDFANPGLTFSDPLRGWPLVVGASLVADEMLMNWISPETKRKSVQRLWVRHWIAFGSLLTLLVILAISLIGFRYWQKTALLHQLRGRAKAVAGQIEKMETLARRLDRIHSRVEHRVLITDMLARLAQARPAGLYLNRLEWTKRDGVVIQGLALDEGGVSRFQKELISAALFGEVSLQYTQHKPDQADGVYFKIRGSLNSREGP